MEENLDEFDYMIINVESCLNGSLTLETFTKRIYNDRTVFLTGVITGDATVAALYYPNSIKPQSVNIVNQINIFNT